MPVGVAAMDQRRHYRIPAKELEGFSVSVARAGLTSCGVLKDVSAAGAGVVLPADAPLALQLGEHVVLQIGIYDLPSPLEVRATTRFAAGEAAGTRYGFQFDDPDEFGRQLPSSLRSVFNRRLMVRAQPNPEAPIGVVVTSLLATYERPRVEVRDLSGIGVSLMADHQAARRLEGLTRLRLTLRLPGAGGPMEVIGRICYFLSLSGGARLGVEFDPRTTEDFAEKQRLLVGWVVRRQQEEVERTAVRPPRFQGR
jgi:hypothetical protein